MALSIGIGGVSRAGKTTLATYIKDLYPNKKTHIISMDDYVHEPDKIPRIKDRIDWEGILIFYSEEVNKLFDKRIFIDIPKSLFYIRRRNDTRWGKEPRWYIDYVWESYLKYGRLQDPASDTLYIKGDQPYSALLIDEYLYKVA